MPDADLPMPPLGATWSFGPLTQADAPAVAEIRAVALRPALERLGRYDDRRVRERFLAAFDPSHAWGIVLDGALVGCVALRPDGDERWLEHFLLLPEHQGRGIGGEVLAVMLDRAGGATVQLDVLQGSDARRLYERNGFVEFQADEIDVWMVRHPLGGPGSDVRLAP